MKHDHPYEYHAVSAFGRIIVDHVYHAHVVAKDGNIPISKMFGP